MTWPNKVYSRSIYNPFTDYNDAALVRSYLPRVKNGLIHDITNNANLTALRASSTENLFGPTIYHSDGFACGVNATGYYPTLATQSFTTILATRLFPTSGVLIQSSQAAGGGVAAWFIVYNPAVPYILIQSNAGGSTGYFTSILNNACVNTPLLVAVKADFNVAMLYISINGNSFTSGRTAGAFAGFVDQGLILGGRSVAGNIAADALLGETSIYSELKSDSWVRQRWLNFARVVQFKTGWGAKVSVANENTVGAYVGQGSSPFEILSGTWKLSTTTIDGELHKVLECVSAGMAWLDRRFMNINSSEAAYGGWRFRIYHAANATPTTIGFTATAKNTPAVTTGYYLRVYDTQTRLGYYNAGAYTDLTSWGTGGGATETLDIQVGRRYDGAFQYSYRRLSQPWTATGTYTNTTYTTSEGMSINANAGDLISLGTVRDNSTLIKYLGEFLPTEV